MLLKLLEVRVIDNIIDTTESQTPHKHRGSNGDLEYTRTCHNRRARFPNTQALHHDIEEHPKSETVVRKRREKRGKLRGDGKGVCGHSHIPDIGDTIQ